MEEDKLIWRTEEDMQAELDKKISEWKQGYSRDGYVRVAEGKFRYKGVPYLIKVIRYYNHTNRFCSMSNRISDKHVLVEYPEELNELVNLLHQLFSYEYTEFLYHDTQHSHNDNQTTEEQILECHILAKEDIDDLKNISDKVNKEIERIRNIQKKIEVMLK